MSSVAPRTSASREPSAQQVRDQLARILSSEIFVRSERLTSFLRFVVDETLHGRGDTLKEHVLAVAVYGRESGFDPSDPIVRIDARRLRDRLREYYASAPRDPVLISIPKGHYAAIFERNPLLDASSLPDVTAPTLTPDPFGDVTQPSPGDARARTAPRRRWIWIACVAIVTIGAAGWGVLDIRTSRRERPPPIRLLTVTSLPGSEGGPPALSPDGNMIVFAWTGPDFSSNGDLWVKTVDGDAMRRLTDTPQFNEVYPAWSPDGRQIAFSRADAGGGRGIYVVSPLGGPERRITDSGWRPAWLPDSQSLVFNETALFHYVLATGARRQLTTPPAGFVDRTARVSPDGKYVAFVRSTPGYAYGGATTAALFVLPLPGGEPVRLDDWVRMVGPPEWTPDSREILYPRWGPTGVTAFRVAVTGGPAAPAAGLPNRAYTVSTSGFRPGGTFRVAVVEDVSDVGLRLIDLHSPRPDGGEPAWSAFCDSTRLDWPGGFSRDGTRVAFTSDRDGPAQVFVAGRAAPDVQRVTTLDFISVGLPSWSPDGQFLVFDAVHGDHHTDLFVQSVAGGPLRRLTDDVSRESDPEWSSDGRWIFYGSDVSGRSEIWKVPATGGRAVPLTTEGGMDPHGSPDGRGVYFLQPVQGDPYMTTTTVRRVSVDGGVVSTVMSGVRPGRWDVTDAGIVFLTGPGLAPDPANQDALERYSFTDGHVERLATLPFSVMGPGYHPPRVLAVSPDGRWAVVSHMDRWDRDITVADDFR